MRDYGPFIIIGLTTGAVYALAATGLVLTYITSGVFNFAHGAVGMFATYLFYSLRVDLGVPTAIAAAITILFLAPLMGLFIDRALLRRLVGGDAASYVVTSLGLLVALQGMAVAIYGGQTRRMAPLFPTDTYRLPGLNVGIDQTAVVVIALACGVGLAALVSRTKLGLQTRAVVGDPELAELSGTDTTRVTTLAWMLGSAFAALSGILFVPFIGLDSLLLTLLVVQAFGAAIVGGLRSLSIANLAAYGVGIGAGLATKLAAENRSLAGLPTSLPFIILFLVLLLAPKTTFTDLLAGRVRVTPRRSANRKVRSQRLFLPAVVVAAALPAVLSGSQLLTATATLIFVLIFASLSVLVGLSRQVSLCHAVFAAFGATTLAHLLSAGVPFIAALPLAALTMAPIGAVLAIPAIRLSGLFLALATFAFGVLAQNLLFNTGLAYGRDAQALIPRPSTLQGDVAFYYFVLAVVALSVAGLELCRRTRLGRMLRALADSQRAVESLGINPTSARVLVFAVSAACAGLAGALLGTTVQNVNPATFDFFQSLIWLTLLVAAGAQTLGGSILAALLLVAVPTVFTATAVTKWQPVAFGVGAILLAQTANGLVGLVRLPNFTALAARSSWRRGSGRKYERRAASGDRAALPAELAV